MGEGEVRECSQELADIIVNADKGIIVNSDVGNNANEIQLKKIKKRLK